jgi:hypothetical protein
MCVLCFHLQLHGISTSASSRAQPKPAKQQKQAAAPPAAAAPDGQQQQQQQQEQRQAAIRQWAQQYQRSRLREFYNQHMSRELMLKLNVQSLLDLPRVKDVVLSVNAKDLHGKRYVSGEGGRGRDNSQWCSCHV